MERSPFVTITFALFLTVIVSTLTMGCSDDPSGPGQPLPYAEPITPSETVEHVLRAYNELNLKELDHILSPDYVFSYSEFDQSEYGTTASSIPRSADLEHFARLATAAAGVDPRDSTPLAGVLSIALMGEARSDWGHSELTLPGSSSALYELTGTVTLTDSTTLEVHSLAEFVVSSDEFYRVERWREITWETRTLDRTGSLGIFFDLEATSISVDPQAGVSFDVYVSLRGFDAEPRAIEFAVESSGPVTLGDPEFLDEDFFDLGPGPHNFIMGLGDCPESGPVIPIARFTATLTAASSVATLSLAQPTPTAFGAPAYLRCDDVEVLVFDTAYAGSATIGSNGTLEGEVTVGFLRVAY